MGKGRAPCCDKTKVKRGPWSQAEDLILESFIQNHGHPNWRALPNQAGLLRCGKSCRLRWINYLQPHLKRGNFTPQEEETIIQLHHSLGNKWSKIASHLPGRTDNEIKNVWNTHLKKRACASSSPCTSSSDSKHQTQNPRDMTEDTPNNGSKSLEWLEYLENELGLTTNDQDLETLLQEKEVEIDPVMSYFHTYLNSP